MSSGKSHAEVLKTARAAFVSRRTRPLQFRKEQLNNLRRCLIECEDEILAALHKDLRKAKLEAALYEVQVILTEIERMIKKLNKFAQDEHLPLNTLAFLDRGYIRREPLGVVLILGTWNYPFLLTLKPLVGAIAAGNCAVIKPSEVSEESAQTIQKLLHKYLDQECYQVVLADVQGTQDLLKLRYDHIFYTGSTAVAPHILAAAAPNLTPVTLELGGKSPCYIDQSADFDRAAKRIIWGKVMNLGMTCIAPDYLLCSKEAEAQFIKTTRKVLEEWYGSDLQQHPDIPRIINLKQFNRIKSMLDKTKGKIVIGGKTDEKDLWIEPTLLVDVDENDAIMKEEIFGPLFPIITVNSYLEAADFINKGPKPLALYAFSKDTNVCDKLISLTSSGGVCVNDVVWHNAWEGLPFGGVGDSGMGMYHGKFSFDTFSHKRAVLKRGFGYASELLGAARYPPYTPGKLKFFKWLLSWFEAFNVDTGKAFSHLVAAAIGAVALYLYTNV